MDSWTEKQIKVMRIGGNKKFQEFLTEKNVDNSMDIRKKYYLEECALYRLRLQALRDGKKPPNELPKEQKKQYGRSNSAGSNGGGGEIAIKIADLWARVDLVDTYRWLLQRLTDAKCKRRDSDADRGGDGLDPDTLRAVGTLLAGIDADIRFAVDATLRSLSPTAAGNLGASDGDDSCLYLSLEHGTGSEEKEDGALLTASVEFSVADLFAGLGDLRRGVARGES